VQKLSLSIAGHLSIIVPYSLMKKIIALVIILFVSNFCIAQEIAQVQLSGGATLSSFAILTDYDVLIRISEDGKVLAWGTEVQSSRNSNYYSPQLQPYPGRIDYYGVEADSINRGKVKSIGSSVITYFNSTETDLKKGKIRSIGRLYLDYFDGYDNKAIKGKLRSIGGTNLQYYTSFDDQALVGKLKAVGNTMLVYYSSFDDKLIRGKIKAIGPISYTWYTSLETQYGGGLKSGPFRTSIGGVVYVIQ
jgi:hypothetical protein